MNNASGAHAVLAHRSPFFHIQAVSDQQSKASSWATKYLKALDEEVTLSYHERLLEAPLDILIVGKKDKGLTDKSLRSIFTQL